MATAGPNASGTISNDNAVGTVAWSNPSNAASSNNSYATASIGESDISNYLKFLNFGFSVTAGATIDGVTVAIERKSGATSINDSTVKLVKGGAVVGNNKASGSAWPTSDGTATYGGVSDLWGTTLTADDVNASNFGFVLTATGSVDVASVDFASITITYTEAATGQPMAKRWGGIPFMPGPRVFQGGGFY